MEAPTRPPPTAAGLHLDIGGRPLTGQSDRGALRTSESTSLEQLLGRCADRDHAAFAEFYRLTSAALNGLLVRLGIPADRAQNALVATYVAIWRHSAGFADRGDRSAWRWTLYCLDRALSESSDV